MKQYYEENKTPLLIFLLSAIFLVVLTSIIYMFGYFGYIDLTVYLMLDILFLGILLLIVPIGLYYYREGVKKRKIQERLPEFLVEIGDSLSTGMTIFDAIKVAEKGHYGELTPEIKQMKAQLSWNISTKDILNDFATRMKSALIQRIVITLNKGLIMGGNTLKIFKATAREVDQINQLEKQRKTNMSLYSIVIILCFFVFLAIILILNKTIFTSFLDLQQEQIVQLGGFFTGKMVDPTLLKYSLFSFVYVQSIGAGILSGFMMDDNLSSGVRYSCVLAIISIIVFKFLF
jgi:flagellar protein FlaJ